MHEWLLINLLICWRIYISSLSDNLQQQWANMDESVGPTDFDDDSIFLLQAYIYVTFWFIPTVINLLGKH